MGPTSLLLPRRALAEKTLETAGRFALTVVVAPTGYGKTTLARSVAEATKGRAYYYSVPDGPHDARFLWSDMLHQLEEQGFAVAAAMRRAGFPETASQAREVFEQLRRSPAPVFLLLDDYHHVTDAAMSAFWENLCRVDIPGVHVVLFSRVRPGMHLEELRIKGLAVLLEQDMLAFSRGEIEEYFRLHGITEAEAAEQAWKYSEGWPAALWLCLQSWKASGKILPSPDIESLLAGTVFSSYGAEQQDFLMRISVLDSFTPEEATELSADPRAPVLLRALWEKNAFLSFDLKTGRYHMHGIFRDFLHKELVASAIDRTALYRQAGECCLRRPSVVPAFRFFVRAGRDEDLARVLDIFLLEQYDKEPAYFHEEIFRVTSALPWRVREKNPLGYISFVALALGAFGDDARTGHLLEEAEEYFYASKVIPESVKNKLRGECAVIRGMCACNDIWQAAEHYIQGESYLRGPSALLCHDSIWYFSSPSASFFYVKETGRYRECLERLEGFWPVLVKLTAGGIKEGEKAFRAEYHLERGEFGEAEPLLREVLRRCAEPRSLSTALLAGFGLARLLIATGRSEEASEGLQALRSRVERADLFEHFECLDMAVGYCNACLNRIKGVPQWLRDGEIFQPPHNSLPQAFGVGLTVHCKALFLQKEYHRLALTAGEIASGCAPYDGVLVHIHGKILQALAAWHTQKQESALAHLGQALELARPDGILLPFVEYGRHIAPLLRGAKLALPEDAHLAHIHSLLKQTERLNRATGRKKAGNTLLTPREREFMACVVKGLSNPAIAKSLGVSTVTVKKALVIAYIKLKAANRIEAVQRFIELYGNNAPGE